MTDENTAQKNQTDESTAKKNLPKVLTIREKLTGASLGFIPANTAPGFFHPFASQSRKDIILRVASVPMGIVIHSLDTMYLLIQATSEFLKGVAELLLQDFSTSKKHLKTSAIIFVISPLFLITAVLSPLLNLIDLIGGAINSFRSSAHQTPSQENTVNEPVSLAMT